MAFTSPKAIRLQCKKIADIVNDLFDQYGRQQTYVVFTRYVGNLYKITIKSPTDVKTVELQLQFDPFEVKFNSSQKNIIKMTGVAEIAKAGNGYKFIP